jgi:actin-like ATPase involved in cell morphogenesis
MPRIGIDLGTTNSLAALVYDDGPHVIPRGAGETTPSVVFYNDDPAAEVVGREADNELECVVRSAKRLMGRTYSEAMAEGAARYFRDSVALVRQGENDLALEVHLPGGQRRRLWPHEVGARVLAYLRARAAAELRASVDAAVVTVPAYFRDPHRAATLDAAREAGLEVAGGDLLDEPSAAALAFAPVVGVAPGEQVLVVDWGGGTFDVTVQSHDGGSWLQRAIDGDLVLGGDDLEEDLVDLVAAREPALRAVLHDEAAHWTLRRAARQTKEALSHRSEAAFTATVYHPQSGRPLAAARTVSRGEFEERIAPRLARIREIVERCLTRPDVDRASIRKVLMVGGSSRIPAFRAAIQALLPQARLHDEVDPMAAVALGAAIYANDRPEIGRICPYGYAFVDDQGACHDVVPPESPIPTPEYGHYGFRFETRYAAQTVYRVTLQAFTEAGTRRAYHDRQRLFARGMPALPAGAHIDAEIWLDGNKQPQVVCYVDGDAAPRPMAGREEGTEELFTRLTSLGLEAEAKLEANQAAGGELIESLRGALGLGSAASESRDREQAAGAVRLLQDNLEQLEAKVAANQEAGLSPDQKAWRRAMEWVPIFENEVLPKFWDQLRPEERTLAIERIRAVRVMAETGAPAHAILAGLDEVREGLFAAEAGPLAKAWYRSYLLGVPERMAGELRERALACRAAWHDAEERDAALGALHESLAESELVLKRYWATATVVDASPDLVIPPREAGRGH